MSLSFWDWTDIAGVALVLIGVAGGYVLAEYKPAPEHNPTDLDSVKFEKLRKAKKHKAWKHFWERLLIVGLVLEMVALGHHIKAGGELKKEAEGLKLKLEQLRSDDPANHPISTISVDLEMDLVPTNEGTILPQHIDFEAWAAVGGVSFSSRAAISSIGPGGLNWYSATFLPRHQRMWDAIEKLFPTALAMGRASDKLSMGIVACSATNVLIRNGRAVLTINGKPFRRFDLAPVETWRLESTNSLALIPAITNQAEILK